jgi:hypothetical protein
MADYYCLVLENLYARAAEWAKKWKVRLFRH